eukprot:gnl/Trimastix_PCT/2124.p1 GENE.gnl/Trimastix_PCT/2124~~gnl/Trimastix_PCT/2124.p1  ORF type:complete len:231 (+),score=93.61 gnl/Trimastix_PCT/2124:49-693(+)
MDEQAPEERLRDRPPPSPVAHADSASRPTSRVETRTPDPHEDPRPSTPAQGDALNETQGDGEDENAPLHPFDDSEVAELKTTFDLVAKKDGTITLADAATISRGLGLLVIEGDLIKYNTEVNEGAETMSFDIWLQIHGRLKMGEPTDEEVRAAFELIARDPDGNFSMESMMTLITTAGEPMAADEAEAYIKDCDFAGAGAVAPDALIQQCMLKS